MGAEPTGCHLHYTFNAGNAGAIADDFSIIMFALTTKRGVAQVVLSVLAVLLGSCGYNRFGELPDAPERALRPNVTLSAVARFYAEGGHDLPDGTVVGGRVTTSDSAGNIYKMVVIQQGETPLALLTGTYDTYSAWQPGTTVAVRLDGLRVGEWEGMLAVGAPEPNYTTGIDYIASEAVLQRIVARTDSSFIAPVDTLRVTVPEVSEALAGRLVRVTGGRFLKGGVATWSGEQSYVGADGNRLQVYTSPYATFADYLLPEGEVELVGIVTVYREVVQLKISSTRDVFPVTQSQQAGSPI